YLEARGIACEPVNKVREGSPHCVDRITAGEIDLVVNTTEGKQEIIDSFSIRRETLMNDIPYVTTIAAARIATAGRAVPEATCNAGCSCGWPGQAVQWRRGKYTVRASGGSQRRFRRTSGHG
ncbi:MAG: hypothetical protein KY432_10590, partial [Acidobacteria bacterium]|nr:hypothetical protein [Acidobacteriota bacterium]